MSRAYLRAPSEAQRRVAQEAERQRLSLVLTVDMEVKFVLAAKLQFARAGVSKDRPLCTPWTVAALADHVAVVCSLVLFRVQGLGFRV